MQLRRRSMISRLSTSKALSLHRLVQFAVFLRMPEEDRIVNFDTAVRFLYVAFPSTWQDHGPNQGHGFAAWATCSTLLPHVRWLMQMSDKHHVRSDIPDMWAELIFRAGR